MKTEQPLKMLKYGLIHLTARTYAVCIKSGITNYSSGVGAGYPNYKLVTKPLTYEQAQEALRIIATPNGLFTVEHESWFPDHLPLDRSIESDRFIASERVAE